MKNQKVIFGITAIVLALILFGQSAQASPAKPMLVHPITGQAPNNTFVVTKTNDSGDNTSPGSGTLRRALLDANNTPGFDAIVFDIAGSGVKTITVKNYFPDITDNAGVMIDGTQGDDRIEIDGSQVLDHHGFAIGSNNNVIKGLVINGVQGGGTAIALVNGASNNVIIGNYLGTNPAGTAAKGNHSGILVANNANNNRIGGTNGVSPGGACTGDCNLIAGNRHHGIVIDHSSGTLVQGNFVGTNVSGTGRLANGDAGVLIGNSDRNQIGGMSPQERNVISGNGVINIEIGQTPSHHNTIQGNYIGVNSAGTAVVTNGGDGIVLDFGAHDNLIDNNVISGQRKFGILVFKSANKTTIQNNRLGVAATSDANLGNGLHAIELQTNNNSVVNNRIAFSAKDGIHVKSGVNNALRRNEIFGNKISGINLASEGFTPNDTGDGDGGANNLQNFPSVSSAQHDGSTLAVSGKLNSRPNTRYTIDLFHSPSCAYFFQNPVGQGKTYLGSTDVTTNSGGNASYSVNLGSAPGSGVITSTATDSNGNTSEFSECRTITSGQAPPSAPQLLSPSNGESVVQNPPKLDWTDATGVQYYKLIIRNGGKKGPKVYNNSNITASEFTPPALANGKTYYWMVRGCAGTTCVKSKWFSFSVP
ncbi:MAG: hypothetical protein EYC68_01775 [Chloroflexota bacterium]|nr:MAG: hypothetical protein EYC68_01775 [Chloroflexota bacterium]